MVKERRGSCGRCHRGLSVVVSIQRGLGPDCFAKLGFNLRVKTPKNLDKYFETIVERFISHGLLADLDADYMRAECKKALEDNDCNLAELISYEAVHFALSGKVQLGNINLMAQDIGNMFDLSIGKGTGKKQERYVKKRLSKLKMLNAKRHIQKAM